MCDSLSVQVLCVCVCIGVCVGECVFVHRFHSVIVISSILFQNLDSKQAHSMLYYLLNMSYVLKTVVQSQCKLNWHTKRYSNDSPVLQLKDILVGIGIQDEISMRSWLLILYCKVAAKLEFSRKAGLEGQPFFILWQWCTYWLSQYNFMCAGTKMIADNTSLAQKYSEQFLHLTSLWFWSFPTGVWIQ